MLFNAGNKLVNLVNKDNKLTQSRSVLLCLALGLPLCACNNMVTIPEPDTQPIRSPDSSNPDNSAPDNRTPEIDQPNIKTSNGDEDTSQCKGMDPTRIMCTAQYDPVCVKVETPTGVSYKTAGNSCSVCLLPNVISYVAGECA